MTIGNLKPPFGRFFCFLAMGKDSTMKGDLKYIKAKLKTLKQLQKEYPPAMLWGKPISMDYPFPSADEIILKYLGKTVWLSKKRTDLFSFHYEIRDSGGIIVLPDWIDYFDSENLVPPSDWKDPYHEANDDTWLDHYQDRVMVTDDLLIITG